MKTTLRLTAHNKGRITNFIMCDNELSLQARILLLNLSQRLPALRGLTSTALEQRLNMPTSMITEALDELLSLDIIERRVSKPVKRNAVTRIAYSLTGDCAKVMIAAAGNSDYDSDPDNHDCSFLDPGFIDHSRGAVQRAVKAISLSSGAGVIDQLMLKAIETAQMPMASTVTNTLAAS